MEDIRCPWCDDWDLDTGGECSHCGYDSHKNDKDNFTITWLKLEKDGATKEQRAEFLRRHTLGSA